MPEKTSEQVIVRRDYKGRIIQGGFGASYTNRFGSSNYSDRWYRKIRQMRRDPVISLLRTMLFAGVIKADWSVEINEDFENDPKAGEIKAEIKKQFMPLRMGILEAGVRGCFDFGWQPFEVIFDLDFSTLQYTLKKLKPLIQDITEIRVREGDGAFNGFMNQEVELSVEESFLLNWDVEGTMWWGQSQVELAEQHYDERCEVAASAARYDKKAAGAHWVVKYPPGKSPIPGSAEEIPNSTIADAILATLEANGTVAIPQAKKQLPNNAAGWEIELVSAQGTVTQFLDRLRYQDVCIARVLGWPERAILEGQYGTKAEAGEHGDFVVTVIEYRHDSILELVNKHLVNRSIVLNHGEEYKDAVCIKAARLNDDALAMLRSIYDSVLANPDGFLSELDRFDLDQITSQLGIPRKEEEPDDTSTEGQPSEGLPVGRPAGASGGGSQRGSQQAPTV